MEAEHPAIELRRQLESSVIQRDHSTLRFVSKTTIDKVWPDDDDALKTQLGLHDWEDAALLDILRKECRTIACILCWMQYSPYSETLRGICEQFRKHEQPTDPPVWCDTRLPLSDTTCGDLLGYQAGQLFYLTQFIFIPIVISAASKGVQEVHPERRWPYNESPKDIGFGAYGRVFKVSIVKGHLKDTEDSSNDEIRDVACKKVEKPADWRKEVKNLDFLKESLSGHKRLLLHLAAFIQSQDFFIFLPYTKLGDLETFFREGTWQDDDSAVHNIYDFSTTFRDFNVHDLAREFAAIIGATAFLHDGVSSIRSIPIFCAHADLRPQNILIFPGGPEHPAGVWHISDFGISAIQYEGGKALPDPKWLTYPSMGDIFEGRWSPSGAQSVPRKLVGPYVAPEMSMNGISTPKEGDVWSLGCILTELLAFSLGTSKPGSRRGKLEEFRGERRSFQGTDRNDYFFDRNYSTSSPEAEFGVSIKRRSKVTEWLQWFHDSKTGLHKDLASIANEMLQPNPEERCTAKYASNQIDKAYDACIRKASSSNISEGASSQPQKPWTNPPEWRFLALQGDGHGSDASLTFIKHITDRTNSTPASQSTKTIRHEILPTEDDSPESNSESVQNLSFQRAPTIEATTGGVRPWKSSRRFSKPAISAAISDAQGFVVYLCKNHKVYELEFQTFTQDSWTYELPPDIEWQHVRAEGKHAIATGASSKVHIYDFEEQTDVDPPECVNPLRPRKLLPLSSGAFIAHDDKRLAFLNVDGSVHEPNLPAELGHSGQVVFGSTEQFWFSWSCQPQGDTVIIWTAGSNDEPRTYATYAVPRPPHARPKLMSLIPCGSLPACCLWDGYRTWYTASAGANPSTDNGREARIQPQMSDWQISGTLCVANERHFFFITTGKEIFSCDLVWQNDSRLDVPGEPRLLSETSMEHPHKMALRSKGDGKYDLIICNLRGAVESLEVDC